MPDLVRSVRCWVTCAASVKPGIVPGFSSNAAQATAGLLSFSDWFQYLHTNDVNCS